MKHIQTMTQVPGSTDSFLSLMLGTKFELMEENTFLKELF